MASEVSVLMTLGRQKNSMEIQQILKAHKNGPNYGEIVDLALFHSGLSSM